MKRTTKVINRRSLKIEHLFGTAVSIMRPGMWGNPFVIGVDGDRAEVLRKYRAWFARQPQLIARLHELHGMTLICCCKPKACHGDFLVDLVELVYGKERDDEKL